MFINYHKNQRPGYKLAYGHYNFKGLQRYEDPPVNDDKGGSESSTIKIMRTQLEAAQKEAGEWKDKATDLDNRVKAIEREKMDENTRLKAEKEDLSTQLKSLQTEVSGLNVLKSEKDSLNAFVTKLYDDEIAKIPEEQREKIKSLTLIEGNPISSLQKLHDASDILGVSTVIIKEGGQGTVTQPTTQVPEGTKVVNGKVVKDLSATAKWDFKQPIKVGAQQ